LAHVNKSI